MPRLLLLALPTAAGLASLLLLPIETFVAGATASLRLAALVQPALLAALALWAGHRFAPALGLGTPLLDALATGQPVWPLTRSRLPAILAAAAAAAALILLFSHWSQPRLAPSPLVSFRVPLATRLLYGGLVEEIMVRWGLMSALAAGLAHIRLSRPIAAAILLSALLFAAGHLPLLVLSGAATPALAAAVLAGNTAAGLILGWLFWRHGLESAMLAHAGAHLLAALADG